MTSDAGVIDAPDVPGFEVVPHHCFACGTLNEHGLGLVLHTGPQRAWVDLELPPRFQGWDDIVHGGISCTILDEVMAWALAADDDWGVTARMSVEFRAPVHIGQQIRAEGWTTRKRRRVIDTAASLIDRTTNDVLATATGVYMTVDEGRKQQLRERYGTRRMEGAR